MAIALLLDYMAQGIREVAKLSTFSISRLLIVMRGDLYRTLV